MTTGVLFPAGDASALADAIQAVLDRRDDWQRFRERARRFVENERTWARSVARYAAMYGPLIQAEAASARKSRYKLGQAGEGGDRSVAARARPAARGSRN